MKNTLIISEALGTPATNFSTKIAEEAISRGWQAFECDQNDIFLEDGKIMANAKSYPAGEAKSVEVKEFFDAVHFRPNPPINMEYLTVLYLLKIIENDVVILNKPSSIINFPEKIIPHMMGDYSPASLISQDKNEIVKFAKKHGEIVVKPLYGFGGFDIKKLSADEVEKEDFDGIYIYQEFMEQVREGTARINMLGDEIHGHFRKIPPANTIESNFFDDDGLAELEITPQQRKICEQLKQDKTFDGIFFCGIDFIGDTLLEVNITSPGVLGVFEVCGLHTEKKYWDLIESKC